MTVPFRIPWFGPVLVLCCVGVGFGARNRIPDHGRRALVQARYRAGVELRARGRASEALVAFEDAVLLDPGDTTARTALRRLRAEISRRAATLPTASGERGPRSRAVAAEDAVSPAIGLMDLIRFERTVAELRDWRGEQRAMQGRIAQLLAERRVCRAQGRTFTRERELHALCRRQVSPS